ncbi:LptF/LptG family permease [Lacinutrix sp. MedPE-SW]|uniref:LptF/LptG family permease n=1 Tax=Lacinutrix sp. MedPE-SW TaxID=1860087 RepID=UPI00090F7BCC|nr:LptF/LptG family permease [Lacinutrix sp. MedPE-SW]OIQ24046.1 MAG: permease [Lacinutrix sp. MedPE-SW]
MKILDRYILTSYLKTFISVFVILMLIFVLQAIWLYIKELAGKDLDPATVVKFLFYITPTLIPLILPLTILLASIMVFGNFAENYEFAAMKSTGISLQRAMSGLSVFIVALSITTFFFSNNVIPWAEYNSFNLRKNIAKVKPAMAIAEGQFNQIGEGFNIKVSKKTGDRGQFLEKVVIHQSQKSKPGNFKTIIAENGELVSAEKSDVLKLILFNGYYYDDTPPKNYKERLRKPFAKSIFDKYTMNIDLSQLNAVDLDDKSTDNKYSMLNISQLNYTTDSLHTERQKVYELFATNLEKRTNINTVNLSVEPKKDTTYNGNIIDLFQNNRKIQLLDYAINATSSTTQIIQTKEANLKTKSNWLNRHIIALHEKFALAFACVILFFVGAPLGALIRKGGLGLPMVIAIVLFLTYHFIGIFAKNSAKDGTLNPVLGTWFSTLIMLPLSIYLTRRATADRGIFEFDHITVPIKNWYTKRFGNKKKALKNESKNNIDATNKDIVTSKKTFKNKGLAVNAFIALFLLVAFVILHFVFANNKLPEFAVAATQLSAVSLIVAVFYFIKYKFTK